MQLQKELADAKAELRESEEYADMLNENLKTVQEEFDQFKRKRIGMAEMNTGKLVGFFTDYLIKSNPVVAKKLPIISTLSGLLLDEGNSPDLLNGAATPTKQEMQTAATFTKKKDECDGPSPDPATQSKLAFLAQMEEVFNEDQMEQVIDIIEGLMAHPDQIATFHSFFYAESSK